jgi:predicted permease
MGAWLRRLSALVRRKRLERDLDDELAFHLAMREAERRQTGEAPTEARGAAYRQFGNVAHVKHQLRDAWIPAALQDLMQDLRFATRLFFKNRGFTAAVVATLALGIGATHLMFTLVNAILFRHLPTDEHGRVVSVGLRDPRSSGSVSYLDYLDLREATDNVTGLGVFTETTMNVSDEGLAPERFFGAYLSADAFRLVGASPILGRAFLAEEDRPDAAATVILGHVVWRNRYQGDPSIIGRAIRVNGQPAVVVGVMASGFQFPTAADVWQPLGAMRGLDRQTRGSRPLNAFGQLKEGVTQTQALAELNRIAERLAREYPETHRDTHATVESFTSRVIGAPLQLIWLAAMGAAGFVLLIACANVANLLLARSSRRAPEISLRVSLGATRWRIIRQLLLESALLATAATAAGFGMAALGLLFFGNYIEQFANRPYWIQFSMDGRVFAFLSLLTVGTTFLFGLAPALQLSRTRPSYAHGRGSHILSTGLARRWNHALVVAELTLTLVLLAGCGLQVRSLIAGSRLDHTIETAGLLTMRLQLPASRYPTPIERNVLYRRVEERLQAVPAIASAAFASELPVSGATYREVTIEGRAGSSTLPRAATVLVGAGYFETLRLPILRGRALAEPDARPGNEGAIVNEAFVTAHFAGEDPMGQRIRLTARGVTTPPLNIVGVSPSVRQSNMGNPGPVVYLPYAIQPPASIALLVRSTESASSIASVLREEVRTMDDDLPLFDIRTMEDALTQVLFPGRIFGTILAVFASLAVILAAVGLYGVMAYTVAKQMHELGIRIALGAQPGQIVWLILRRVITQFAVALPLGLAGAFGVGRLMQSILIQTDPTDPPTLASAIGLMGVICLTACIVPVRRAIRLDPLVALRYE